MMNNSRYLTLALERFDCGHTEGAVDLLKQVLASTPDEPDAHALLALCLIRQRRLFGAEAEARIALSVDPQNLLAHQATAALCIARRKFQEARGHTAAMLELAPNLPASHRIHAKVLRLIGGRANEVLADGHLDKALALAPDSPDTLVALGTRALAHRQPADAERHARAALEAEPEHVDGLVLMGQVALRRGDVGAARDHAIWALRNAATDTGALGLLAGVKARQNWFTGLWWRYATWMAEIGTQRAILVLLFAFASYRFGMLVLHDMGALGAAKTLDLVWLAVCIYTWVGPSLFQRMLAKELATVQLREF
jgi:Tfp pilus assembly protein PilF